jgi:hypothetical protein
MKKILLKVNENGVWLARFCGPERELIVEIMGTDEMETGFLWNYDQQKMISKLSEKNPGYVVEVEK